ncbi:MAG: hypothetical protein EDM79_13610 [Chloroflexi bacterium]|nr:MAG: hypothetical protein EDM79_13610 [Chloroflexota bacterium]
MVFMFRLLGYDIRQHHFSTERDVEHAAETMLRKISVKVMKSIPSFFGNVYEIGNFIKPV